LLLKASNIVGFDKLPTLELCKMLFEHHVCASIFKVSPIAPHLHCVENIFWLFCLFVCSQELCVDKQTNGFMALLKKQPKLVLILLPLLSLGALVSPLQTLRSPCLPIVPSPHPICHPRLPAAGILRTLTGLFQTGSRLWPGKLTQRTRSNHRGTTCMSLSPWMCRRPCTCSSSYTGPCKPPCSSP